jgi:hypothetical protein
MGACHPHAMQRWANTDKVPVRDYTSAPIGPPLARSLMNYLNTALLQHFFIIAKQQQAPGT